NGAIKVEYAFENLPTFAAFDAYAYTVSSNQGQGIRWTNRLSAAGSSGYAVLGQPLPEAPIADFTANVTSGEAPLAVLFTDASTDTPTSWAWDFEDDGTVDSIEQNPVHTYTAAGTYTVNLTVANDGGSDTEVKTDYITVTEPTGPSEPAPLPAPRHIFFKVANDAGVKYNLDSAAYGGPNGTYYIKADGGGLNELHITNDADAPYGQVASGEEQSGTLWITNTGGRGFDDDIIILISVNGTIPDDFALHIKSSGYTWTPSSTVNAAPTDYTYVEGALNETFTKEDFIYGPQTWKPGPGDLVVPSLPLYYGQDINDQSASSYLMFVDLNVGNMYPSKFPGATLTDDGGAKVEFTFTNLTTHAAFNAYGWCLAANQGQGISWTNRVSGTGSSGYTVTGVPYVPPSAPVADFAANVTSGDAPLVVQFTDASTGDPTSWAWDFENDGIVDSTEQSPVHTYTAADTYSVNLTVTNAGGSDTEVKTGYIQVSPRLSRTWTVGASGCDFTTLMDAINSASVVDGDTVYVYNGTYSFTTSTKAVTVMGENTERVTLDLGATTGYIRGNGATFEKLRFTNGRLQLPSLEPVAQNILVRDCIFEGMLSTTSSMSGSILVRGQNCAFENNTFRNNVIGTQALVALYSSNLRWENNTFTATTGAGAAVIRITQSAANVLIKNNRFSANTMPCISFMANTGATPANKVYLNDFIVPAGVTPIAKTGFGDVPTVSWTTSGVIPYTYQGTPQTGILGNYWSPYNGTDANSDGIGDTPYDTGLLNDNNPGTNPANVDPAPLMAPVADYFGSAGPAAPVAAFSANVTNGTAPLTVAFTDASTGDPTSWVWDFEDDGIVDSTEQSPVHTYTAAGTYTVNLTVANAGGSDAEIKTGYITVTEPTGPSVLPGYNNIFVKVANDLGVKYNAFDNNTYNIRFEGIGRGLNALHISTDPAVNFGQVTVSENQSGTFYATDSGGKGYEDEIILMVAVNGTIPDDFRLRVRADGYTWTPNPERNRAPSLDNVTYQASSLDEVFTKEDFIYGPQTWKPTGDEADYPLYAGQDMTDTENTFRIMFIDLNAGVLRPNEALENRGAVRINYAFENLESFAAFSVYGYCKNPNNGDDMVAWTNALTSDRAMSGYSVIGTDADAPAGSAWPMYGHDLRHTGLSPYTGPEFPVQLWSHQASSAFYVQPVLDADGTVYAGSRNRVFYAINSNGTLKWSYTAPNQIYTAAAIDRDGTVYFGNRDAKIYAMNPDGTVKWTFTTGGIVSSAPAIGAD
ncbi:MAG: PKD domain-containing protein, partial [Methanoculleus horonobensis]|nr:PKD domain-containing protein [Methanoculleus horonobensis]